MGQFGITNFGASELTIEGRIQGLLATATSAGVVDSITIYLNNSGGSHTACCALYENTGTLLGQTEEKTIANSSGWFTFNFLTRFSISATGYIICAWADLTAGDCTILNSAVAPSIGRTKTLETYDGTYTASVAFASNTFQRPFYCDYTTQKVLSDGITVSEIQTKRFGKVISDTISVTESLAKLSQKVITASITTTDSATKKPTKVASDSITITDTLVKNFFKVLSDSSTITDTLVKGIFKQISDSITVTDSVVTNLAGASKFIKTRYITGDKQISTEDLRLMKQWIQGLKIEDIEQIKKDWIKVSTEDTNKMTKDLRDMMKS